ncbi:DoxX family protein [Stenotrophomonas sp. ISL-67]|uniref:HvfX family Cu-binding RiPP maturation protein n=1 Tax=Stenotrophomonas sp. ISL-67 TaxID=2819171 RepID=UPI001BECCE52|nr:DoxX family protein [Stenotrophomonas sp. ISL-67]MBT2766477.1 DoxX family protein [Stenotrophomonas sp. ISL-67]
MRLPFFTRSPFHDRLDGLGTWLAPLGLRLLMAWEYLESGLEKWRGVNWFENVQAYFPLPLRWLPAGFNWQAATWLELVGGACLLLGIATRATAALLIGLTVVATAAVHWPAHWDSLAGLAQGYVISDQGQGNFKLPLLFVAMLLPLLLQGAGRLSVDACLARAPRGHADALAWGGLALATAWPLGWLLPAPALALAVLGATLLGVAVWQRRHGTVRSLC